MNPRVWTFVTTLLLPLAVAAGATDHVIVGSWNIEHLGERKGGQHPKALAEHIELAGVDVLALAEVYDTDGAEATRTNEKLDAALAELNALPDHDWEYTLTPKRKRDETFQLTGVAWNRKKVKKEGALKVRVTRGAEHTWNRQPYAIKFSVVGAPAADFILIPVHMKSNTDGEELGRKTREAEARALAEMLDAVREELGDDDVIVLGDTNCLAAGEPALQVFREAGLVDLNDKDAVTYRKGSHASPFDRILVSRGPEFAYSRQYVLTPSDPEAHLKQLSDHFVVLTAVRVIED